MLVARLKRGLTIKLLLIKSATEDLTRKHQPSRAHKLEITKNTTKQKMIKWTKR